MRKLSIIGIGAGNPDHITVQAIKALENLDVVFMIDKGEEKGALARLRKELCDRYVKNPSFRMVKARDPERDREPDCYQATVSAWHDKRADLYEAMLRDDLSDGQRGAFLVWGDPSLYDSTLRIVEQVAARKNVAFDYEVVPGITSVQALAARHRIALNHIGGAVHITTGRQLGGGLPRELDNVVVMLDGEAAFKSVKDDVDIYWGAYLGTADEIAVAGRLRDCAPEIERKSGEARRRHGWIMDTYLLRRSAP